MLISSLAIATWSYHIISKTREYNVKRVAKDFTDYKYLRIFLQFLATEQWEKKQKSLA